MHNKVKKSRALTIWLPPDNVQQCQSAFTTPGSPSTPSPHHPHRLCSRWTSFYFINSKSPSKSPDSRPGSICAEAQCPLPHRPWVAKVLSDMQVIVAMANNIIIIIITTIAEHSPTGPGSCRSCQTCRWPSSLCSASSSSPSTTSWSSKPGTSWTPTTTTRGTSSQRGSATCQSQERQFSRRSEM